MRGGRRQERDKNVMREERKSCKNEGKRGKMKYWEEAAEKARNRERDGGEKELALRERKRGQ